MSKKRTSEFYAVVNDKEAKIVTSWDECKLICNGKPGGKSKKADTLEQARLYLQQLINERNHRLEFRKRFDRY